MKYVILAVLLGLSAWLVVHNVVALVKTIKAKKKERDEMKALNNDKGDCDK